MAVRVSYRLLLGDATDGGGGDPTTSPVAPDRCVAIRTFKTKFLSANDDKRRRGRLGLPLKGV